MLRRLLVLAAALAALALSACALFVLDSFYAKLGPIHRLIASLPPAEASPPAPVRTAFLLVHRYELPSLAIRALLAEFHPEVPPGTRLGRLHRDLWERLTPLHFSDDKLLCVFLHFMRYEKGTGLSAAARYYFARTPAELSIAQALGLAVIATAPRLYSPSRAPDIYQRQVGRYLELLRQRDAGGAPAAQRAAARETRRAVPHPALRAQKSPRVRQRAAKKTRPRSRRIITEDAGAEFD